MIERIPCSQSTGLSVHNQTDSVFTIDRNAHAVAGQGIIYEPTFIIGDDLRAGTLISIKLDQPTIEYGGIYAVHGSERHPPAKVRALIDFMIERFSPSPPWDADLR
jgi:DNA-binding transcriptional LysR family regulator